MQYVLYGISYACRIIFEKYLVHTVYMQIATAGPLVYVVKQYTTELFVCQMRNATAGPSVNTVMYLYCISTDQNRCKFGFSREPERRLRALQTGSADPLFLIECISVPEDRARELEAQLHAEIGQHRRLHGEWFDISAEQGCALLTWFGIHYAEEDT